MDVAAIKMIEEEAASERVKEIYAEITDTFGIDFVPNIYKVMAAKPEYLEANWRKVKAVMVAPGNSTG